MFQKFSNSLKFFSGFLCQRFVQKRREAVEVIMMLVAGNLMGFYNPNQLADYLGLNKTELYRRIKDWSVYQWQKMLLGVGCEYALSALRDALRKSDATKSRRRISVDDTVIKRCGQWLSYTYSWWSGQYHRTVNGQNLLAITIRIGERVSCCFDNHSESPEFTNDEASYGRNNKKSNSSVNSTSREARTR